MLAQAARDAMLSRANSNQQIHGTLAQLNNACEVRVSVGGNAGRDGIVACIVTQNVVTVERCSAQPAECSDLRVTDLKTEVST